MIKTLLLKQVLLFVTLCYLNFSSYGQLYVNSFTGTTACPTQGNAPTIATNSTGTMCTRATMICTTGAAVFNSTNLNNTSIIDNTSYIEFSITANPGYQLNLTSLSFLRSGTTTAPNQLEVRYSTDGFISSSIWGSAPLTTTTLTTTIWDFSDFSTLTGGTVSFRIYVYGTQKCDLSSGASASGGNFRIDDITINGSVISSPKFYRSITSGSWTSSSTWQTSTDNISWSSSITTPTSSDYSITIQSGNIVTISNSVSLDETTIYGTLNIISGAAMTVNDGNGDDITIQNNGILQASSTSNYTSSIISGTSVINILSGGKIEIGDGTALVVGTGYEAFATNTTNVWNDASTFEWNSITAFQFGTNIIYFQNPGLGIPIFLISKITTAPITGTAATVNGLLMVNSVLNLSTTGDKTFRDGISGNSILTLDAGTGGRYLLTSPNAIIGGTVTINLNKDLTLTTGITIPSGASVTINGSSANMISKGTSGVFLINGTVDMKSTHLTNTSGSVTVNGTLKTSSALGLYGSGSATLTDGLVNLNNNSTIDYNAAGNQIVQAPVMQLPQYFNVTFSGSGIKTPSSTFTPTGTVKITGNATLDGTNHNIGDGVAGTTNFTMDGGRLILGTTTPTTQPQMNGLYNLTGGIVEFAGSNATTQAIRSLKNYYAIEVTGNNVGNSSGNINLNPNGSFTVKSGGIFMINADAIDGPSGTQAVTVESGGIFRCGNNEGFNGFVSTFSNYSSLHQNIENINLTPGSTVEYMRAGDQPITTFNSLIYQNLLLSGSGNKTAPLGTLTIQGNLSKSGTSLFVPGAGIVLLNGTSAQSFAGLTYNNLFLTNNTKTTQGNSTILDSLKVNTATTLAVSSTDTMFIHSDAAKTGRVAQVDGTINNSGKFTVERYIPAKRSWRFLAVPTSSTQSIKSAWQEGALNLSSDPHPGYGTELQTNNASWSANGFDAQSINGPSIKTYNSITDTYTGVTSTLNPFDVILGGYMTFIRGDRTATYFGAPITKTVLRTTGNLYIGNQPGISVLHGKIIPVNNPYASPIDLKKLSSSYNVFYYAWDPNRGGNYGLGAIQTFSWNGTGYDVVPGSGSYGATNNFIESGQAFFVSTLGLDTTIQITETAKCSTIPTIIPFVPVTNPTQLHTNLYTLNADGTTILSDGILTSYANDYSNSIDGMDAKKLANNGEDLSVKSHNQLLVIERRTTILNNDTLFLELTGTRMKQYRFELIADNLNQPGLKAYLEDSYLNNRTSIDLTRNTLVDFTVDPADISSSKSDRFRIVFDVAAAGPLPVTYTNVKAYKKNENIALEWSASNENNLKQYDIEKSADGIYFKSIATVTANNRPSNVYQWLDEDALEGYNYYRIKSIDNSNVIKYSQVVKVFMPERKRLISVYPNPIKNGIINLQLINQPSGIYRLKLTDNLGQVILLREINHSIGASIEVISIDNKIVHGYYNLEVTKPGADTITQKILY